MHLFHSVNLRTPEAFVHVRRILLITRFKLNDHSGFTVAGQQIVIPDYSDISSNLNFRYVMQKCTLMIIVNLVIS